MKKLLENVIADRPKRSLAFEALVLAFFAAIALRSLL